MEIVEMQYKSGVIIFVFEVQGGENVDEKTRI